LVKGEVFGANTTDANGETGKASHKYTYHTPLELQQSGVTFYSLKPGMETIDCSVSVWDPVDGNRGMVTPWRVADVRAPSYTMAAAYGVTTLVGVPNPTYIYSGDSPNGHTGAAFAFSASTPEPFKSVQGPGNCSIAQTLSFYQSQTLHLTIGSTTRQTDPHGPFHLDTSFPYEDGGPATGNSGSSIYTESDTPYNQFFTGTTYTTSFTADDHFRMFLIYLPPGTDSIYVPLRVIPWKWVTAVQQPNWIPTANPASDGAAQDYPIDLFQWDYYFTANPL
jgi:hypothetical protein